MKRLMVLLAATLLAGFSLHAATPGAFEVKLRVGYLAPDTSSGAFVAGDASIPANQIDVSSEYIPEFDITYGLTENLSMELVLTIPTEHEVTLGGSSIGTIEHLPPTLSLVYEFAPDGAIQPYVSAGINWTLILDDDLGVTIPINTVPTDVTLGIEDDSMSWALGAGVRWALNENWDLDASVKMIDLNADVTVGGAVLTELEVDPLLWSFGAVYKF